MDALSYGRKEDPSRCRGLYVTTPGRETLNGSINGEERGGVGLGSPSWSESRR